ncbi:MAG: hypothetical protein ACOVP2_13050, partial [Armatimonadaceae bacterium]
IKGPWDSPAVRNRNIVVYIIPEAQQHDVITYTSGHNRICMMLYSDIDNVEGMSPNADLFYENRPSQ